MVVDDHPYISLKLLFTGSSTQHFPRQLLTSSCVVVNNTDGYHFQGKGFDLTLMANETTL